MQLDIWNAVCPEKGEQTKYQVAAKDWWDAAKHAAYRFIYLTMHIDSVAASRAVYDMLSSCKLKMIVHTMMMTQSYQCKEPEITFTSTPILWKR